MVRETLDALVIEAYESAVDRGDAINDAVAWRDAMRLHFVEQAKREGKGYLQTHHARLLGGSRIQRVEVCGFCEAKLGVVWLEIGDKKFCDLDCAEGIDKRVSFADWKDRVKKDGGYTSPTGEWVPLDQIALFGR
jgi:hypothetical protein